MAVLILGYALACTLIDAKKKKKRRENPLTCTYFGDSPIYPFWDPDGQSGQIHLDLKTDKLDKVQVSGFFFHLF